MSNNGQRRPKVTTRGWELLVLWKDGLMSWVKLKDLKESHPVEVAEYAKAHGIDDKPAFIWWRGVSCDVTLKAIGVTRIDSR